jgi:hypothetical protein
MGGGGGEADHVEQGTATDGDDVVASVDVVSIDLGVDLGDAEVC